ncbi:hypothetical protein ACFVAJ_17400 [Agromyces sp. NPDC057679]|uniref:hypothetical protein n=1 Tax=Agromyces sp. NPDC057679 TaxID=3346207 RepID=UPI003671CB42
MHTIARPAERICAYANRRHEQLIGKPVIVDWLVERDGNRTRGVVDGTLTAVGEVQQGGRVTHVRLDFLDRDAIEIGTDRLVALTITEAP